MEDKVLRYLVVVESELNNKKDIVKALCDEIYFAKKILKILIKEKETTYRVNDEIWYSQVTKYYVKDVIEDKIIIKDGE